MSKLKLILRTLWYFRSQNLALLAGVAVGCMVLAGSLIVGDSVRESLVRIVQSRLGDVDYLLVARTTFSDSLGRRLEKLGGFRKVEALLFTRGNCVSHATAVRASRVNIYGRAGIPEGKCVVSRALARMLDLGEGYTLVVRSRTLGGAPVSSPICKAKDEINLLRLKVITVAERESPENLFSLFGTQRPVRNLWVPLAELQRALRAEGRANLLLASVEEVKGTGALDSALKSVLRLEDYELSFKRSPTGAWVLESSRLLIPRSVAEAIRSLHREHTLVYTSLATTITNLRNGISTPYSTVARISRLGDERIPEGQIVINQWLADDLLARPGDRVKVSMLRRTSAGTLKETEVKFTVERVLPMQGMAVDSTLVPEFEGLTDAERVSDWEPPPDFPFDPSRIRPRDEEYWEKYRAVPRAFIDLESTRKFLTLTHDTAYSELTSARFLTGTREELEREILDLVSPSAMGLRWRAIREEQSASARGTTDFAGLFIGLSFFLIISAGLLVMLLERLSVERRSRQVALLLAVGFQSSTVRSILLSEGALVLGVGSALGLLLAVGYAWVILSALTTVWNEAVGTTLLGVYVSRSSLAYGYIGSLAVGLVAIWRGMGRLESLQIASVLSGRREEHPPEERGRRAWKVAVILVALAMAVAISSLVSESVNRTSAFFGVGALLLSASLAEMLWFFGRQSGLTRRRFTLLSAGLKNAVRNPTRSVLTAGLLASASFILVSVGSMKMEELSTSERSGGSGGYSLIVELDIPVPYDLDTEEGRRLVGLDNGELWRGVRFVRMRVNDGDDVSCRNLYRPTRPRILSVPDSMIAERRFSFVSSLGDTHNPWEKLREPQLDRSIPVIADYETARWILRMKLGQTLSISDDSGRTHELRIVALLRKSIFQGELLMWERNFLEIFPSQTGYRQFLLDVPQANLSEVRRELEGKLGDFGLYAESTSERLRSFTRIANAYISAFETLGGLGMLLGTLGLAIVLMRNVLERRAELALLSALGFRNRSINALLLMENAFLLLVGVVAGLFSAIVAVSPEMITSFGGTLSALGVFLLYVLVIIVVVVTLLSLVSVRCVRSLSPVELRRE